MMYSGGPVRHTGGFNAENTSHYVALRMTVCDEERVFLREKEQ